jgi:hypothetical protein
MIPLFGIRTTLVRIFAPPLVRNANTNLVSNNLGSKPYTSSNDDEVNYYFDQLWQMYPRKVGKGQARKAYVAASKKIDFFDLLPKLEAYVCNTRR